MHRMRSGQMLVPLASGATARRLFVCMISLVLFCCCYSVHAQEENRCLDNVQYPKTLEAPVQDVPLWTAYAALTRTLNTNDSTASLIFRSSNLSCSVEIKLTSIVSSANKFTVYPAGRANLTMRSGKLSSVSSNPCDYVAVEDAAFGASIVSVGPELAISFLGAPATSVDATVGVLYRQNCGTVPVSSGYELTSPSTNGSYVTADLTTPSSFSGYSDWKHKYSWSIAPPQTANCSLEFTFTKSVNQVAFSFLGFDPIVGVTYKLSKGTALVITVQNILGGSSPVTVKYRAVDCASAGQSTVLSIVSWNGVLTALTAPALDQWKTVTVSFTSLGSQQGFAYYVPAGLMPANTVLQITGATTDPTDAWWQEFPPSHKNAIQKFVSTLAQNGTSPITFYSLAGPNSTSPSLQFQYKYVSTQVPAPIVVNNSKWTTVDVTETTLRWTKMLFSAANPSCVVELRHFYGDDSVLKYYPYGFSFAQVNELSYKNKFAGSAVLPLPYNTSAQSVGKDLGLSFAGLLQNKFDVPLQYRMVCPVVEPVDFATKSERQAWHQVDLSDNQSVVALNPPAVKGCQLQVAGNSPQMEWLPFTVDIRVTCFASPLAVITEILFNREMFDLESCPGVVMVQTSSRDPQRFNTQVRRGQFAYRVLCDADGPLPSDDDGLPPFPTVGVLFLAQNKWQSLPVPNYDQDANPFDPAWTIEAKNPECQVELALKKMDVKWLVVFEDFMHDLKPEDSVDDYWQGFSEGDDYYGGYLVFSRVKYQSCENRVMIWDKLNDGITNVVSGIRYRQVCNKKPSKQCGGGSSVVEVNALLNKWQTLTVNALGNLNQQRQTTYSIIHPMPGQNSSSGDEKLVVEVEFTSLVSQSWLGLDTGSTGIPQSETHVVRVNGVAPAIIGKSFFSAGTMKLDLTWPVDAKKGDLIFEIRYRLVGWQTAKQERDLGEVLTATNKLKTLNFKIPQQFSTAAAKQIVKKQLIQRTKEYENDTNPEHAFSSGEFPLWSFKHHYTIQPQNSSCKVMLNFIKIDIGAGFLVPTLFKQEQHRLAVVEDDTLNAAHASKMCESFTNDPQVPQCASVGHTYVSSKNSSTLRVFFRSLQMREEYEYDGTGKWEYDYYPETTFLPNEGAETTWGSGWTATYKQICSPVLAHVLSIPLLPTIVVADSNKWQVGLPGQPKNDKVRLFLDMRWMLIAKDEGCAVEYHVIRRALTKHSTEQSPMIIYQDSNDRVEDTDPFSTPRLASNVFLQLTGTTPGYPVTVKYRQICTGTPTNQPTQAPTGAPTFAPGSRKDGDTCSLNTQCSSAICSSQLMRCTAVTCMTQCRAHKSTKPQCESYAAAGCSCKYLIVSGSPDCQSIP